MTCHAESSLKKCSNAQKDFQKQMERAVAAYHSLEANGLHPTVQKVAQEEDVPHTSLGRYLKP
ncbi:hypothetical protein FRC19_003398, partial [Serendipita sp. 401]